MQPIKRGPVHACSAPAPLSTPVYRCRICQYISTGTGPVCRICEAKARAPEETTRG